MSAKKAKKTTPIKKSAKKQKPKVAVKKQKPAPKKSVAKKIVKKVAAKKIVKKPVAKKAAKKIVKKVVSQKILKAEAKAKAAQLELKKEIKKNNAKRAALAKTLLSKNSAKEKNAAKKVEEPKAPEKKSEALNRAIIVRKSEGRSKLTFKVGDYAVYPSHGVGKIVEIEKTAILGQNFSCYLMYFEKEKLTIKIPMNSAEKIGLRHLISKSQMDEVFVILRSGVKKLKGMWSRRAQEYETKINSGDIILLAEVLRDLTRDIEDGERSYSERIIYETAIYRLSSEYAVIYGVDFEEAKQKVIITAKDKLNSEGKITQKDEFDEFDLDEKTSELDEDEDEESEEEDEDEDGDEDDDYGDDDDDEKPRKKRRK